MIAAIILAAGQSRRMGTQKLLLPFAGQTIIAHLADQFLQSLCAEVFVVFSDKKLAETLKDKTITMIQNPHMQSAMLDSVRVGIKALPDLYDAALVMPGDIPLIETAAINELIKAVGDEKIIVPTHKGKRGHPLLVPRHYFTEIMTSYDDTGSRGLLIKHANKVRESPLDNSEILLDVDTPQDYEMALKMFNSSS